MDTKSFGSFLFINTISYIRSVFGLLPNTRHFKKIAQSLSNHHLEIETSKRIYNWVCTIQVQTEPLYIRLVVSLRALAKVCAFFL